MVYRSNQDHDYLIPLSEGRLVNLGNAMGHPSRIGSFANQVGANVLFEQGWANQDETSVSPSAWKFCRKNWMKKWRNHGRGF